MRKYTSAFFIAMSCVSFGAFADEAETTVSTEVAVSSEETSSEDTSAPQLWNDEPTSETASGSSGCGCGKPKQ